MGGNLMTTLIALQSFLANHQANNLRPASMTWYTQLLGNFAAACPELPKDPEPVEAFMSGLARSQHSESTLRNYHTALRALFRFVADRYELPNPMVKIRPPRITRQLRPTLEPNQVQDILNSATDPRDRALLVLLADTGMRVGELCSIRLCDIMSQTVLVTGKTGQREVPISDETRRRLVALAPGLAPGVHIFSGHKGPLTTRGIYSIISRYMRCAGITGPKLGPHRLRHAFGKAYLVAGGDLRSLQEILGHASITTTQQYVALTTDDIVAKHRQFNLLRAAQATAQGSFLDKAGVLNEAEAILNNNKRR